MRSYREWQLFEGVERKQPHAFSTPSQTQQLLEYIRRLFKQPRSEPRLSGEKNNRLKGTYSDANLS